MHCPCWIFHCSGYSWQPEKIKRALLFKVKNCSLLLVFLGFHSSPLILLPCNTSPQIGQSVQHWASHQKCFKTRYFRQPHIWLHTQNSFLILMIQLLIIQSFLYWKMDKKRYWISEGWAGENSAEEAPRQRLISSVLHRKKAHVFILVLILVSAVIEKEGKNST